LSTKESERGGKRNITVLSFKIQSFTFGSYLTNITDATAICTTSKVTAINDYVFCVYV